MNFYDFKLTDIDGEEVSLSDYKGKVLIIVNTASKCGFTPQYEELQKLYDKYNSEGLVILGFPSNQFAEQEPGSNGEVKSFCLVNYGVSFPLFEKTDVRGENVHPLFKYLTDKTEFKGFDVSTEGGNKLHTFLSANFPETLEGNSIKWNFTKFLINKDGDIVDRYESPISPLSLEDQIKSLLSK